MKNSEDPVRLEPRTPVLRVKHFTTEPRRTPPNSRANKSGCIGSISETLWAYNYIVAKFGTDWSIFADARV